MGRHGRNRRKRANSDEDESLERRYSIGSKRQKVSSESDHAETKEDATTTSQSSNAPEQIESDKLERQRLKQQRRKELKRAKAERRKREEDAAAKRRKEEEAHAEERRKEKKLKQDVEEAASKRQSAFRTLKKGVQCQDVVVGQGPPVQHGNKVRVSYTLRAKSRYGKVLDSSKNFSFRLGWGEVIKGWDIGVLGMQLGGRRYLIVPPKAGYGRKNIGAGPGAILFFDVTVIGL